MKLKLLVCYPDIHVFGKFLVWVFFLCQDFLEEFAPYTTLPSFNNGATVSGKMNGQLEVRYLALFRKIEEKPLTYIVKYLTYI